MTMTKTEQHLAERILDLLAICGRLSKAGQALSLNIIAQDKRISELEALISTPTPVASSPEIVAHRASVEPKC